MNEFIKKTSEAFNKLDEETDVNHIRFFPLVQEEEHKIKLDQKHIELISSMAMDRQCPCIVMLGSKNLISSDFYLVKSASDIEYLGTCVIKRRKR